MSLRRGFKASANRISVRVRRGQGVPPEAPIDLTIIARKLDIAIVPLTALAAEHGSAVRQLVEIDTAAFSAATLQVDGRKRVIVHNDGHDGRRQRSNLAHEISHILLGHPFTFPIDPSGCRNVDRGLEEEANWLGPTILISDQAALHIVRQGWGQETACGLYDVSASVLRMRINASGAMIRVKRSVH